MCPMIVHPHLNLHCQCISKWHHPWIFWQTFYGFFICLDWCMVHKRKRQAFRQMEHWIGICTKTDTWHHIIQINEHVWKNLVRIVFSFVNTKLGALIISMYTEQSIITLKTICMANIFILYKLPFIIKNRFT